MRVGMGVRAGMGLMGLMGIMAGCALMQAVEQSAVAITTSSYLRAHPEQRPAFEAAAIGLQGLIDAENYDPLAFAEVLQQLPLDEFNGADGDLYVSSVVVIWDAALQEASAIADSEAVKGAIGPVLRGLQLGLKRTAPG